MQQAWWDAWNRIDSRRWGDNFRTDVPVGALALDTPEIMRVEAPQPCIWRVMLFVDGFDAADAATFRFLLDIGVGSAVATIVSDASGTPGAPGNFEIAAQTIIGRARLESVNVVAARNVKVTMWAAPVVPWIGLTVQGDCP